jgi:7,8-dihydroneopterin aldolase/epimerase/oxygenase
VSEHDRIELRGLVVLARCGALPEEFDRAQPIEIDLDVALDLSAAGGSDALVDTVDYGALCAAVERVAVAGHVQLLEHLATLVATTVLRDARIEEVTVAARKLRPPVPHHLATAGVRITRRRSGP